MREAFRPDLQECQPAREIAIAVVEHEGKILVGRRRAAAALEGMWEFPGGKIHPGESAETAAERECREETGLKVRCGRKLCTSEYEYPHGPVRLHFFACSLIAPFAEPAGGFSWTPRSRLAALDFPAGNRDVLELLAAADLNGPDNRP